MVLHVPALPHVRLADPKYAWCAYSSKIMRLAAFLHGRTKVYAPTGSRVYKAESLNYMQHSLTARDVVWIDQSDLMLAETGQPEWGDGFFGQWDPGSTLWTEWNKRCIEKIRERYRPGDVIGLIAGWCQREISDTFPDAEVWEWGVGYKGVMPNTWVTFESNAWLSALRGTGASWNTKDSVIPNCFFADEFAPARSHKNYLLFLGRQIQDKGLHVVREIARARPDLEVVCAGQGGRWEHLPSNVEYVGVVAGQEKADLIAGATALLAPTVYLEPFGGVTVEAAMSGVPPITTNWGAFPETIGGILQHPELQCTTLPQFLEAVERVESWDTGIRRGFQQFATHKFGAHVARDAYTEVLNYIEHVGRGESAWYGPWSHLLT